MYDQKVDRERPEVAFDWLLLYEALRKEASRQARGIRR